MGSEREANLVLARAVRERRQAMKWSIDQLVARSGVSKGAIVAVESGSTNPSLSTLVRLADAFGVAVTDLLGDRPGTPVQLVPHAALPSLWQGPHGGKAVLVLTISGVSPVELWTWTLLSGECHESHPHPRGVVETVTVLTGTLRLTVAGAVLTVPAGTTATFQADREHAYAAADVTVTFLMTVHLPANTGTDPHATTTPAH